MGVIKNIKLFVLLLALAVTQANATNTNYSIDQPRALPDDATYAPVIISDSTTTVGDIDFSVELIASTPTDSDSVFYPLLSVHESEPVVIVPEVTVPEVILLFGSALISLVALVRYKRSA